MAIERKQEIGKNDLPYQVMGKYFWAKTDREAQKIRNNIKKNNPQWLAKMAWVPVYSWSKDNGKQNITIANRLRKNDVVPFYDYTTNANKITDFAEIQKINAQQNLLSQERMQKYIANLNDDQIKKINTLTPIQKLLFMTEEVQKISETQSTIVTKIESGGETNNENLATIKELQNYNTNFKKFVKNNNLNEYIIDTKTFTFVDPIQQEKFKQSAIFQKTSQEENPTKKEYMMNMYIQKDIKETGKYETLSDEAKKQFNTLIVESYTMNQNLGWDMADFDMGILYAQAREYLSNLYTNTEKEPCHTLTNNISTDSDMRDFFQKEENKISTLSPQTDIESQKSKDKKYYTQLFLLYPDIHILPWTKKPIKEYLKDFNDDMSITPNATDTQKKEMNDVLSHIQKFASTREKMLINKTNNIVQEYAVSQCVEALQQYMDIDIASQKNLLEQLKVIQNPDAISASNGNMVLKIQGEREGKKMNLSYDLVTGKVYHHPFLYKESLNETDPLIIANDTKYREPPLITLPSIAQILQWAKKTNYYEIIKQSDSLPKYKKNIQETMETKITISDNNSYTLGQELLRKQIIQDDIVQNIIKCTGRIRWSEDMITFQQSSIHAFYNYLERSLQYSSMQSVDQLLLLDKHISTLLDYRNTNVNKSSFDVLKYKENISIQNEEMFVLQSLVNQAIVPQTTNTISDQWPEEKLLSFFKCFEKKIGGVSIIDGEMMDDFFKASLGTNNSENAVGKRKRNQPFTKLAADLTTKFTGDQASVDLEQQLEWL